MKMNQPLIPFELDKVQTTLVLPLWGRAKEARKKDPVLLDACAAEIVDRIGYDFSMIERTLSEFEQLTWAIRAQNFDSIISTFLEAHESALIVNIGAGLDTSFQRIDDGRVRWINVDLPDVVSLRAKLIPDSDREQSIPKSVFDYSWMDDISSQARDRSVMLMAAGVFCYFENDRLKSLFRKLAEVYPSAHLVFDSFSKLALWMANRAVIKKAGIHTSSLMKWPLKSASGLRKWVKTIKVIEEFPAFSRVAFRPEWSESVVRLMKGTNRWRSYNMIHVQFR
jgi:O-methyltransferase involved in polyketide biosynthesis